MRGGQPSITTPMPPPWDSLNVVTRNSWPNVLPMSGKNKSLSLNHNAQTRFRGAQAAGLFVSAACRDARLTISERVAEDLAGKLPATAGWQPALPSTFRLLPVRSSDHRLDRGRPRRRQTAGRANR